MKYLFKYSLLLFTILLAAGHVAMAQSAREIATNLVTNAGFEDSDQPWQLDNWMKNEVSAMRDNKNPHSGNWSMKVQLVKVLNSPTVMFAFPRLAIRPKSAIRIKFWAKGISNGANLTVMVRKEIEPRPTYLRTEMYLTDEWQQYEYTIQLPGDADSAKTSLRFALNQAGVFWIDDVSVTELPLTDEAAAPRSNPIRNASFEAGTDGWTATFRKREFGTASHESGNGAPSPDNAKLETRRDNKMPHGQRCLLIKIDRQCRAQLTSAYFPARYGYESKLRFSLRADSTRAFSAGIGSGINSSTSLQTQVQAASANWQSYEVPFTLKPAQDGVYFVEFKFDEAGIYEIDAVSFIEKGEENSVERYPSSMAIQPTDHGPVANMYSSKDIASFKLIVAGGKPGSASNYRVDIFDYLEKKISGQTLKLVCDADGYAEKIFNAPVEKQGAFRIEARTIRNDVVLAEQLYTVLPLLPAPSERTDSYFGGHADFTPYNLAIAKKAGFRWLRTWPPLVTTWIAAEPKPGVWNFQTTSVEAAAREGFQVVGLLGTAPDFKAAINPNSSISNRWSRAYPPLNTNEWKEYVAKSYNAFSPWIKTWEVWNEPDGGYLQVSPGQSKEDIYLSLLKAAREALDSIGKPVTLLGPAVANINASLGWEILKKGGSRLLDAYSFHFYSLAAGGNNPDVSFLMPLLQKFSTYKNRSGIDMPLWHTEGGMYLQGAKSWLSTYRIPSSSPVKKQYAAASMVRAALFFKAMGVKRYFDFELYTSEAGGRVNSDMTSGFIEVTGIPGPAIAAHAAMVSLTEDALPAGFDVRTYKTANLRVAHFTQGKSLIDVYWSDIPVSLKDAAGLGSTDKVFDMMGNPCLVKNVLTGELPVYVIRSAQ